MSIEEQDYILRMIRQLAQAIARIVGLRESGKPEQALQAVQETSDALLGPLAPMLPRLDAKSAAALIGNPEKLEAIVRLLSEEAAIHKAMGNLSLAQSTLNRAAALAKAGGVQLDPKKHLSSDPSLSSLLK